MVSLAIRPYTPIGQAALDVFKASIMTSAFLSLKVTSNHIFVASIKTFYKFIKNANTDVSKTIYCNNYNLDIM